MSSVFIRGNVIYSHSAGSELIKALLTKMVDPSKDTDKVYTQCLEHLIGHHRIGRSRRLLWQHSNKIFNQPNGVFTTELLNRLLNKTKFSLVTGGKNTDCSLYIRKMMYSDSSISDATTQSRIRNELQKVFLEDTIHNGSEGSVKVRKLPSMITHFINDRENKFASKSFFKKLNGN